MSRALGIALAVLLLGGLPTTAAAAILGHPGAPTPGFSVRLSAGLGYTKLDLDNQNDFRDDVRRLRILGRLSMMVVDWLEVFGGIEGADAKRELTGFDAGLGLSGGGGVRFYPMLQEKFGVNVGLGGGVTFRKNSDDVPTAFDANTVAKATLKERQYHAELTLSRSFQIWNLYGGLMWHLVDLEQSFVPAEAAGSTRNLGTVDEVREFLPVGIFVGVDYFVTPLVFFSLEGQNFHEDTITASIGVLLAP